MSALIETTELADIMDRNDVKILDATFPAPDEQGQRIKGAGYFDIDKIADPNTSQSHMLPPAALFEKEVRALGINNEDQVIVYDTKGMALAAARVWWMFRIFGHDNVRVLNGGLPKWIAETRKTVKRPKRRIQAGNFTARFDGSLVKKIENIRDNITTQNFQVLDVRDHGRFEQDGHIPGSQNLFFVSLLNPSTGQLKSPQETENLFQQAGIDLKKPVTTSCGSGVTACVAALALYELGIKDTSIYDGSWSEWSRRPDLPKETRF
ncbi:MAG: sulfurtransferase [Pseudomonadota bacterium]